MGRLHPGRFGEADRPHRRRRFAAGIRDPLIAWADSLFAQDTIESINEATQLYVLAAEILGEQPPLVEREDLEALDFAALRGRLDEFANSLVDLETMLPAELRGGRPARGEIPSGLILYFCVPSNRKLLDYRDTVADRLFKIRHCMDIEGRTRRLPLFEPPIDPALLVRAAAAGLDLRQALSQIGAVGLPAYRFAFMLQKAQELCNEVRSLGNALLAALEKKDAEELTQLRARHEESLLAQIRVVKQRQIEEAKETLDGLKAARQLTEKRRQHYAGREFMNASEIVAMASLSTAHIMESVGQGYAIAAAGAHLAPQAHAQGLASGAEYGGEQVGQSLRVTSEIFRFIASQFTFSANLASTIGNYQRRQDDWDLQASLAETEMAQVDKQIAAAEIRLAIAEHDKANHEKQLEQSREVEDFLRRKFTNRELYGWMSAQLAALHYQAYTMAFDLARKAERSARHELGLSESEFRHVEFGHWDSLKKGLLAGERLHQQLRRMDMAYLERNSREHEITKHVSLAMLNPAQLIQLRETGNCTFKIPELLFDLDFPSHYRRRLKSVRVTIPCVTGPYTNVSAKLSLQGSWVRQAIEGTTAENYPYNPSGAEGDARFHVDPIGRQSIATSTAQSDGGLFEFNFRDERYLPFEGAGAISRWSLELPSALRQFDYDTISDVVLHLSYTARDGGDGFKSVVNQYVTGAVNTWLTEAGASGDGLFRMISLRQEFGSHLHRFLYPAAEEDAHETTLAIRDRHFPHLLRGYFGAERVEVTEAHLIIQPKDRVDSGRFEGLELFFGRETASSPPPDRGGPRIAVDTSERPLWGGLPTISFTALSGTPEGRWKLRLDPSAWPAEITVEEAGRRRLDPEAFNDVYLIFRYRITEP